MTNQYSVHIVSTLGTQQSPATFTALIRQSGRRTIEFADPTRRGLVKQIGKALIEQEIYHKRRHLERMVKTARKGKLLRVMGTSTNQGLRGE